MAYTPTTWANDSGAKLNATNMNHLETGVQAAAATADAAVQLGTGAPAKLWYAATVGAIGALGAANGDWIAVP